ncbi:putative N-acetyltransferase 16 isoform X1 [Branchiostoma floridae x Branchiostoma japonicum]
MDEDLLSRMTVREATHGDYQAVMNMASLDTFRDGFDYLPAKFHGFVDDHDTVFLLVELDGEVVFLDVQALRDGGESFAPRTMRMAKTLQGRGFSKTFTSATRIRSVAKFIEMSGQQPKTLHVLRDTERHDLKRLDNDLPFKTKSVINIMYFCWDATPIKDQLSDAQMSLPALVPYQPNEIHRLLPPAFSAAVLSEGLFLVDWDPYKLSEPNMKKLVEAGCYILVDSNVPAAKSLSFGGSYMTPRGRVYHIDIHCKDEALCKAHITNHVMNACSLFTGMITFCVMVTEKELKDVVVTFCVQYLHFKHLPHDHAYTHDELDFENFWMAKPVSKAKY